MSKSYDRFRPILGFPVKRYDGELNLGSVAFEFVGSTCNEQNPCPRLVFLCAKMGLHRYNMLQGTKFQLICVKKYIGTVATYPSYYITLDAMDPTGGSSLETFQTKVSRGSGRKFILTCNIARIRVDGRDDDHDRATLPITRMPEWPPENPLDNYYRLKESEVQDNDWIRLYLELAVAVTAPRGWRAKDTLSELEIVNVALGDEGALNANNATLYIRYNETALDKVSDRMAIVRRSFDDDTGCFILVGETRESSEIIPKNVANEDMGCLSLKGQEILEHPSEEEEDQQVRDRE